MGPEAPPFAPYTLSRCAAVYTPPHHLQLDDDVYRSSTSWPCPTDAGVEVTCGIQINYPTAEAALAGTDGTVGQFGFSVDTEGLSKGQLKATLKTLAAAAGEHERGRCTGYCNLRGRLHMSEPEALRAGRVQPCMQLGSSSPQETLTRLPYASAVADEMTRKGWEAGPENDI